MNNQNLIKTALHYGALSGIAMFLFLLVLYAAEANVFSPASVLGAWIPVLFIVLATKFHRDKNLEGQMNYKQGLAIGISTSLFSSSLFGLCFYLFTTLFAPELLDSYRNLATQSLQHATNLFSESLTDKALENIEKVTISSLAFNESFNKLVWGVVVSLVTSGIFRKNVPVTE